MAFVKAASVSKRTAWALALALLLGLRLLSPPGFMPSFTHGAVTITICPDAEPFSGTAGHDHSNRSKSLHQPCAYASAAWLGTAAADAPQLGPLYALRLAPDIARS